MVALPLPDTLPSDAEFLAAARAGNDDAYGQLYARHVGAARAAARSLTRSHALADDLVGEGFTRVLSALRNGGGPEVAFRPYLLASIRTAFYDRTRKDRRVDVTDDVEAAIAGDAIDLFDPGISLDERHIIAKAFASLPERWQLVLWHTEVEGRSPAEVAPLLGLAPNAVAALGYRAREGLRKAYLQAHLQLAPADACRYTVERLGAYVRDGVSAREREAMDEHLAHCDSCAAMLVELQDVDSTLRRALVPLIVGVGPAVYLKAVGASAGGGRRTRSRSTTQMGIAAALVAALVAAGVAANADNEPPDEIATVASTTSTTVDATSPTSISPTTATVSPSGISPASVFPAPGSGSGVISQTIPVVNAPVPGATIPTTVTTAPRSTTTVARTTTTVRRQPAPAPRQPAPRQPTPPPNDEDPPDDETPDDEEPAPDPPVAPPIDLPNPQPAPPPPAVPGAPAITVDADARFVGALYAGGVVTVELPVRNAGAAGDVAIAISGGEAVEGFAGFAQQSGHRCTGSGTSVTCPAVAAGRSTLAFAVRVPSEPGAQLSIELRLEDYPVISLAGSIQNPVEIVSAQLNASGNGVEAIVRNVSGRDVQAADSAGPITLSHVLRDGTISTSEAAFPSIAAGGQAPVVIPILTAIEDPASLVVSVRGGNSVPVRARIAGNVSDGTPRFDVITAQAAITETPVWAALVWPSDPGPLAGARLYSSAGGGRSLFWADVTAIYNQSFVVPEGAQLVAVVPGETWASWEVFRTDLVGGGPSGDQSLELSIQGAFDVGIGVVGAGGTPPGRLTALADDNPPELCRFVPEFGAATVATPPQPCDAGQAGNGADPLELTLTGGAEPALLGLLIVTRGAGPAV